MKLQIKDSGAWRNAVTFTTHELTGVRAAAAQLLRALNQPKTVFRIAEGDTPIDWCEAPACTWRTEELRDLPKAVLAGPAMTRAQVEAAYMTAAYDIEVEPSDEEIVELMMATFGMARRDVIRRIDQFNFVEVVSSRVMPAQVSPHEACI